MAGTNYSVTQESAERVRREGLGSGGGGAKGWREVWLVIKGGGVAWDGEAAGQTQYFRKTWKKVKKTGQTLHGGT